MIDFSILFLIGRVLFGGFFLLMGLNHFMKMQNMVGYSQSKGLPMPQLAVIISGTLLVLGGAGVVLGLYVEWAVVALVLFLGAASIKMHDFWAVQDPQQKMVEMSQFMKNMALLGAALMLLQISQPWAYSLSF